MMSDDSFFLRDGDVVDCVDGSKTVLVDGMFLVPPSIGAKHCIDVHVTPILSLLKGNVRILDIGFGAGWTASALLDECQKKNCIVEIVGVEKSAEVYSSRKNLIAPFVSHKSIRDGVSNVRIIIDDATKIVGTLGMFDSILLDGWNEQKTPNLYSEDFLKKCFSILKNGGAITVNTGSWNVEENLIKAGLKVETIQHQYIESLVGWKK